MLARTHVAIGIFAVMFFLEHVVHKFVFIGVLLVASLLPDIDSAFSVMGTKKIFRIVQVFTKHRGLLHSFTFCVAIAIVLAFFYPIIALPFFLGYGLHLFADSLTVEGIRPFWPLKNFSKGRVRVGGTAEHAIFVTLCIVDAVMIVSLFI